MRVFKITDYDGCGQNNTIVETKSELANVLSKVFSLTAQQIFETLEAMDRDETKKIYTKSYGDLYISPYSGEL